MTGPGPGLGRDRLLPGLAVLACLCGLVGLYQPLIRPNLGVLDGAGSPVALKLSLDAIDLSLGGVPFLGGLLTVVFLGLAVLPAIDLCTARARLTGLLTVPALLGLLAMFPLVGLLVGVTGFSGMLSGVFRIALLDVGAGAGAVLLVLAESALLVLGPLTALLWWRDRSGEPFPPDLPPESPPGEPPPSSADYL